LPEAAALRILWMMARSGGFVKWDQIGLALARVIA